MGAVGAGLVTLQEFSSLQACSAAIAEDMGNCLGEAIERRGQAVLAVSGGKTPRLIFPLLARRDLAWDKVCVTLVDERWMAPEHPESNEKLARDFLLKGPASKARFMPLKTPAETPQGGVEEVAARLNALSWPLDAVFLGLGEDGHIASLFPGDAAVGDAPDEVLGRCVAVAAKAERTARMSLSPSALLDSRRIFLVLSGAAKRAKFKEALSPGPPSELPLRLALLQDRVPVSAYWAGG